MTWAIKVETTKDVAKDETWTYITYGDAGGGDQYTLGMKHPITKDLMRGSFYVMADTLKEKAPV